MSLALQTRLKEGWIPYAYGLGQLRCVAPGLFCSINRRIEDEAIRCRTFDESLDSYFVNEMGFVEGGNQRR